MLFLLPLVTYWPATFHDFGLRDDYSNLREAHEEPGKVVKFARPRAADLRLAAAIDLWSDQLGARFAMDALRRLAVVGRVVVGQFSRSACARMVVQHQPVFRRAAGVDSVRAGDRGMGRRLPYVATALLAVGGFFTVEGALAVGMSAGPARAIGQWMVALGLMVVSALIYQPSAMFYVVPLAGALIVQRHRNLAQTARWVGIHLGFVVVTLGLAYCVMSVLYAMGVFVKSGRVAFEHNWGGKIAWFLQETLRMRSVYSC